MVRLFSFTSLLAVFLALISGVSLTAQGAGAAGQFLIEPLAERTVDRLPEGPLHWRIETFSSLAAARDVAGPFALAAEHGGRVWLFTLGAAGEATRGGTKVAEIGPIPRIRARRYLLRVNRAGGPPGAVTPVHAHPGTEAFYVLRGRLTQRTVHGIEEVGAGETMNGHDAELPMQLASSGTSGLDQLVLFVVDADRPFSSAAAFE